MVQSPNGNRCKCGPCLLMAEMGTARHANRHAGAGTDPYFGLVMDAVVKRFLGRILRDLNAERLASLCPDGRAIHAFLHGGMVALACRDARKEIHTAAQVLRRKYPNGLPDGLTLDDPKAELGLSVFALTEDGIEDLNPEPAEDEG